MQKGTKELLDGIHNHLEYQKMMGVTEVPRDTMDDGRKTKDAKAFSSLVPRPSSLDLESIRTEIGNCTRCKLHSGRHNIVFGVGNPNADLMFIGEGPGADEDAKGEPFVGRAGQLLNKIISAMGLNREDVYITNVVMCRPPNNRNPEPDEIETCMPYLLKRIAAIQPKIIVCLGAIATKALLNTEVPISKIRGKLIDFPMGNCKLLPTYHPAFLLRNPAMKKPVWEDMQVVMNFLSIHPPKGQALPK